VEGNATLLLFAKAIFSCIYQLQKTICVVFDGACIVRCNELVFDCCQPGSTRARCVFGYVRVNVESDSHDTQSTLDQALQARANWSYF
jgi:hypothetical protein